MLSALPLDVTDTVGYLLKKKNWNWKFLGTLTGGLSCSRESCCESCLISTERVHCSWLGFSKRMVRRWIRNHRIHHFFSPFLAAHLVRTQCAERPPSVYDLPSVVTSFHRAALVSNQMKSLHAVAIEEVDDLKLNFFYYVYYSVFCLSRPKWVLIKPSFSRYSHVCLFFWGGRGDNLNEVKDETKYWNLSSFFLCWDWDWSLSEALW